MAFIMTACSGDNQETTAASSATASGENEETRDSAETPSQSANAPESADNIVFMSEIYGAYALKDDIAALLKNQ